MWKVHDGIGYLGLSGHGTTWNSVWTLLSSEVVSARLFVIGSFSRACCFCKDTARGRGRGREGGAKEENTSHHPGFEGLASRTL